MKESRIAAPIGGIMARGASVVCMASMGAFTLLDVTWAAMRLLSLGMGGVLADRVGIAAVYIAGGTLFALAAALGLALLGRLPLNRQVIDQDTRRQA